MGREYRAWTCADLRRLREMADRPRKEIALALGRTVFSVENQAKRAGIELTAPRAGNWPDETIQRARAMRARGLSSMRIALRLGVPVATVDGWIHKGRRLAA